MEYTLLTLVKVPSDWRKCLVSRRAVYEWNVVSTDCVHASGIRGFAKLKKIKKTLDRAHPTDPPTSHPNVFFVWKPITDMDRTLKS